MPLRLVVTVAVFFTAAVLLTVIALSDAAVTVALTVVDVCVVAVAVVIAIVVIIVVTVTVAKAIVFVFNLIAGGVAAAVNIAVFALNTNILHTRLKELTKTNVLNYY
jgi:hypothetical protein